MSGDYEALNERLQTLPDQLSYDIMVGEILTANNTTQHNTTFIQHRESFRSHMDCAPHRCRLAL